MLKGRIWSNKARATRWSEKGKIVGGEAGKSPRAGYSLRAGH